ncbi:MAG TPA: hypothetical protein VFT71_02820 [Candidatus Nitrosocosmicus sp.]|nr:hypothetical protein [Candidatus Nitrosocosmicus sp.]
MNKNNKEISKILKIPLSTEQRRVRHIIAAGFLSSIVNAHFVEFSTNHVLNSAMTVITGFLTYKVIFAILKQIIYYMKYI